MANALSRYHEQALNAAALITALATSHLDEGSRLRDLLPRQDLLLHDLLHDFAYKARKTIEAAKNAKLPIVDIVTRRSIMGVPPSGKLSTEELYSLEFILGRVIHSLDLAIERAHVPSYVAGIQVYQEAAWAFRVRSDFDPDPQGHLLFIEFVVEEYLMFAEGIQSYLDRSHA
jgi:hypothetical protein